MIETSSPIVPAGNVIVNADDVVLQNTPCPAAAVKAPVLTAYQEVPPPI